MEKADTQFDHKSQDLNIQNLRKLANELDAESTPSKDKEKMNGGDALVYGDSELFNNGDRQDLP